MIHRYQVEQIHERTARPDWDSWAWEDEERTRERKNYGLTYLMEPLHSKIISFKRRIRKPDTIKTPTAFPFLQLPRELREMIYDYFRPPQQHIHQILNAKLYSNASGRYILHDHEGLEDSNARDDPILSQPPARYGILSYQGYEGGRLPCLALRMTCRQIHDELWDHVLSRMAEVGPLTPHHDDCRFDATYQKLGNSSFLPFLRSARVRIDLADLRLTRKFTGGVEHQEIRLEECVPKVQERAEMLVRVLRKATKALEIIVIDWKDDFSEDENWELKSSVLLPFGTLSRVQMTLGKLMVAEKRKTEAKKKLEEIFEGLSASG